MEDLLNDIKKDNSIKFLIRRMSKVIRRKKLIIEHYWDADLCAIVLIKGNKLIYITKNESCNKSKYFQRYSYDLETYNSQSDLKSCINRIVFKSVNQASIKRIIRDCDIFF